MVRNRNEITPTVGVANRVLAFINLSLAAWVAGYTGWLVGTGGWDSVWWWVWVAVMVGLIALNTNTTLNNAWHQGAVDEMDRCNQIGDARSYSTPQIGEFPFEGII